MKNQFPGHYPPTDEEFERMWREGIFVFDANVLLNIYRYSKQTNDVFLSILNLLNEKEQVWIPYQVGKEYQNERPTVIKQQRDKYQHQIKLLSDIENKEKELNDALDEGRSHPHIPEALEALKELTAARKNLTAQLDAGERDLDELFKNDEWRNNLDNLLSARVGTSYDGAKLEELYKEAEQRYKKKIPPGYMDDKKYAGDEGKEFPDNYSDFIIWRQILDKGRESGKDIIFVTDDSKEDWWWKVGEKTFGPRPELVTEFQEEVNARFHIYQPKRFLEFAEEHLDPDVEVTEEARDEVEEISKKVTSGRVSLPFSAPHDISRTLGQLQEIRQVLGSDALESARTALEMHKQVIQNIYPYQQQLQELARTMQSLKLGPSGEKTSRRETEKDDNDNIDED